VVEELEFNDPYVTLACKDDAKRGNVDLPAGESKDFDFYVITSPDMPSGHEVNMELLIEAMYGRTYEAPFKVVNSGSNSYCMPGNSNCSGFNDRITSLIIVKKSDQSVLYSNTAPQCVPTIGYTDYTNVRLDFVPGTEYTMKVKTGYINHRVKGWIDYNGNNSFEESEACFTIPCAVVGTEYTADFTIPADFTPGDQRFRIRTRDASTAPGPCDTYSYGQTLDYTAVLPELYPRVQNVEAVLGGSSITVTWQAPATGTPTGYNIYRNGDKLNGTTPLTDLSFTETDIEQGVYAYSVKAVYASNKESFAAMSNVICHFWACNTPENLEGSAEGKTAVLSWDAPEDIAGTFEGYNIYRDEVMINANPIFETTYSDENLPVGTYKYQVSALSNLCVETDKTEEISITIDPELCAPPVNVTLITDETSILITWDDPEPEDIDGVLLGYNVYLNEVQVNGELLEEREYRAELTETGSYQVSVVYAHCESDLSEEVGIKEYLASSFNIFPNPANNELRVTSYALLITNVEIYDVQGRMQNAECRKQKAEGEIVVNVSHLQSGIYFVKIYSDNNIVVTKRLVIMK
jgi:hypothetical protein